MKKAPGAATPGAKKPIINRAEENERLHLLYLSFEQIATIF